MNHERCRFQPNRYIAEYGRKLGSLAVNTALVIKHEALPPAPQAPVINRSELRILDDEHAIITEQGGEL